MAWAELEARTRAPRSGAPTGGGEAACGVGGWYEGTHKGCPYGGGEVGCRVGGGTRAPTRGAPTGGHEEVCGVGGGTRAPTRGAPTGGGEAGCGVLRGAGGNPPVEEAPAGMNAPGGQGMLLGGALRGRSPRTREGRIGPTARNCSGQWSVVGDPLRLPETGTGPDRGLVAPSGIREFGPILVCTPPGGQGMGDAAWRTTVSGKGSAQPVHGN